MPAKSLFTTTSRIMAMAMGLGALVVLGTCAFVVWELSKAFNDAAQRDARTLLQALISEQKTGARTLANDYAVWDAMYDATLAADAPWLDDNVGSSTLPDGTMDFVAVIHAADGLRISWFDGERDGASTDAPSSARINALVRHADDIGPQQRAVLTAFANDDGRIWMFAMARVTRQSGESAPGTSTPLLIVGIELTHDLVAEMGRRVLLPDLRIAGSVGEAEGLDEHATLLLNGPDGPVALLRWTPPAPALGALVDAAPFLGVGVAMGGGLLVLVGLHILRAARHLESAVIAAQAGDRAKSRFLAIVSHELRTPMNGVIGMLQLLDRETLDARPRRWAQTALSSARSLLGLVDGLLTFSRLDAGDFRLSPAPTDPGQVIADVVALFEPAAQERGLKIQWAAAPMPLMVLDAAALRQIVTNLLGNAVKFADGGAIRVDMAARPEGRAWRLELAVEDDGPGVPPEAAGRIFEAFAQVDDTAARRAGGVGLGLSIVRGLARAMGGDVQLAAADGPGSRFVVTLLAPASSPAQLAA